MEMVLFLIIITISYFPTGQVCLARKAWPHRKHSLLLLVMETTYFKMAVAVVYCFQLYKRNGWVYQNVLKM